MIMNLPLKNMVSQQIAPCSVIDPGVQAAFYAVDRARFVPPAWQGFAYADVPIPLGHGQHMLLPKEDGQLLQALRLSGEESVLEIGTGSGYLTALLAQLSQQIYSVESCQALAATAQTNLAELKLANVNLSVHDGREGWLDNAPYDRILITTAWDSLPTAICDQCRIGGVIIAVLGQAPATRALCFRRLSEHEWQTQSLFDLQVSPAPAKPELETFDF